MSEVTKISADEAIKIIVTREPRGLFYIIDKETRSCVGIDNSDGSTWTEEFKSLGACKRWLWG